MAEDKEVTDDKTPTLADLLLNMDVFKKNLADMNKALSEKDDVIEILTVANIDLINIDMELISIELHNAQTRLLKIGTVQQFDTLREIEKRKGINMAYNNSKIYLEDAGREANMVIPTLNIIKISLEKISEKLKYTAES